jgi:predicted protein tyrosine phosphatase
MQADRFVSYEISICGLDEIPAFAGSRVSHALSILDPEWPDPDAFCRFSGCRRHTLRFHDIIDDIAGWMAPTADHVRTILSLGTELRDSEARHLLIHCHAGVSRSTAAAAILLAQFHPGREDEVFGELARLRAWSWPNSRMVGIADEMLRRQGRLCAALRTHHGRMIKVWPERAALLREGDRAREFQLAG